MVYESITRMSNQKTLTKNYLVCLKELSGKIHKHCIINRSENKARLF